MSDVELTPDEVRHVASLARIGLDDAEVERLGRELTSILGHVNAIARLPIADVPPTKHANPHGDALRIDASRPGASREEALANAPDPTAEGFRVPPIGA
ncbi:MAG: Asp-tRNA(Asn)/Glu-tRNA(Gln) amidotransferase subunit GatC [Gaiellales bacterium]